MAPRAMTRLTVPIFLSMSSLESFNPAATELPNAEVSHPILAALDARIDAVFASVQQQPYWQETVADSTPVARVRAVLREIFLSVHWYQPHTTEAGFAMIG